MDRLIGKAALLIHSGKFAEADKLLIELRGNFPSNTRVLSLSAEVALWRKQFDEADHFITSAIGLNPQEAHLFHLKARLWLAKDNYDAAEEALSTAMTLDPTDSEYFAFMGTIKLQRKQYQVALDFANHALSIDATDIHALNVRSTALLKLKNKAEAFATIEGALAEDPNNAFTHATYGWGLLEESKPQKALVHFKAALQLNPNLLQAQGGMMAALKARYFIYRLFLRYAFWMGNLTKRYQWAVIIGFYAAMKGLQFLEQSVPSISPIVTPLIIILAIIAFSTWVIQPISNLFLRLNKFGRHLLDRNDKISSVFVGVSLLICITGVGGFLLFAEDAWLTISVFGFAMVVPYSVMLEPTKRPYTLIIYTIAMAGVGIAGIATSFISGNIVNPFAKIFVFGFIAFQWIANYLLIKQSNH